MGARTFMYHPDHPKGKIFDSDDVSDLEQDGWVDDPKKINRRVGRIRRAIESASRDDGTARAVHRGFGKYDVWDGRGNQVANNVPKDEASRLEAELNDDGT